MLFVAFLLDVCLQSAGEDAAPVPHQFKGPDHGPPPMWDHRIQTFPALLVHVCSSPGPSVGVVTDGRVWTRPAVLFHLSSVCCRGDVGSSL